MPYIDLHADTITELKSGETLEKNSRMINLEKLRSAGCLVQCFSAFVPTGFIEGENKYGKAFERYREILDRFNKSAEAHPEELLKIRSYADVLCCAESGKTGMLLTIEDGGVIGNDLDNVQRIYSDGVRLVTLTWNHENPIGYPNSTDSALMSKGLKPFGVEVLRAFESLGVIVDVSHLSDGGFWDVVRHSAKPFLASHSNARALTPHPRNLTDNMIRAIADKGGIIGLNFYGKFLSDDGVGRVSDMVRHAIHIYNVGGSGVLALGSDFDGISGELEVTSPADMDKLFSALSAAGISHSDIELMKFKNALRFLGDTLGGK